MDRRHLVFAVLTTPLLLTRARAASPWSHRILNGGFDGKVHHLGLYLKLDDGWKTYWRVPGSGGIPPTITVTGENVASFAFDCPLPQRFQGEDGETIGYKHDVVFPIRVTPVDASKPVDAMISAFMGVCEVVCIPAQIDENMSLSTAMLTTANAALLQSWISKVPQPAQLDARAVVMERSLYLTFSRPATEVFIEFLDGIPHYATVPVFGTDNTSAMVEFNAAKVDLRNRQIRITVVTGDKGLEQELTTL